MLLQKWNLMSSSSIPDFPKLERIHYSLKNINAQLWRELRNGDLARCYVGHHSVTITDSTRDRDWREVNRRTVSLLQRFSTTQATQERHTCLVEALDSIAEKILLVQLALRRKAHRPTLQEDCSVQRYVTALHHLSCFLGACHEDLQPPGYDKGQ